MARTCHGRIRGVLAELLRQEIAPSRVSIQVVNVLFSKWYFQSTINRLSAMELDIDGVELGVAASTMHTLSIRESLWRWGCTLGGPI